MDFGLLWLFGQARLASNEFSKIIVMENQGKFLYSQIRFTFDKQRTEQLITNQVSGLVVKALFALWSAYIALVLQKPKDCIVIVRESTNTKHILLCRTMVCCCAENDFVSDGLENLRRDIRACANDPFNGPTVITAGVFLFWTVFVLLVLLLYLFTKSKSNENKIKDQGGKLLDCPAEDVDRKYPDDFESVVTVTYQGEEEPPPRIVLPAFRPGFEISRKPAWRKPA
jgi:hypothetical protein